MNMFITKEQDEVSLTSTNTAWSLGYHGDACSRWREYTDMMETNTNLIAHGVWASNKNTVIRDENSLRLASSQPFFLESDVAARSINIHGRAGSSWHLIQDFTNIAGNLYGTFFIHQNKGMFLQENWTEKKKRKKSKFISEPTRNFANCDRAWNQRPQPHGAIWYRSTSSERQAGPVFHGDVLVGVGMPHVEKLPWQWSRDTYLYTREYLLRQRAELILSPEHRWSLCHHLRAKKSCTNTGHHSSWDTDISFNLPLPTYSRRNSSSSDPPPRGSAEWHPTSFCPVPCKVSCPMSESQSHPFTSLLHQQFLFMASLSTPPGYL